MNGPVSIERTSFPWWDRRRWIVFAMREDGSLDVRGYYLTQARAREAVGS